ncbi:MAG: hypothetical protein KC619_10645 [Myxococcales bacterium]|nr:hypothetical protein [Myxococcales bacterium]
MRIGLVIAFAIVTVGCQSSYYQECRGDGDCDDDQRCERVVGWFLDPEAFCTAGCVTSDDCVERFGPNSYCGLVGACFEACTTDADCPRSSTCEVDGVCAIVLDEEAP